MHRKILDLIEKSQVGNLLIQFHLGNMPSELVLKSQRLFATQVAPALREDSARVFAKAYREWKRPSRRERGGGMSMRTLEINGRKVSVLEDGTGEATLYLHGFADVHGVTEGWMPFHEKLLGTCRLYAPAHPGCAASDEIEYLESVRRLGVPVPGGHRRAGARAVRRGEHLCRGLGGGGACGTAPGEGPPARAYRRLGPVRARGAHRRHLHDVPPSARHRLSPELRAMLFESRPDGGGSRAVPRRPGPRTSRTNCGVTR